VAVAVIAKRHGIDKVPATVPLAGEKDFGIRVFGLTGGYEFASLLEAIEMSSTGGARSTPPSRGSRRASDGQPTPRSG